jgi:glycosyltransferase involved in cell wall biosynthesis
MLTSGHSPTDGRIFYKEALSLKKIYDDITIIAPNEKIESIQGIKIINIKGRKNWWNRLYPSFQLYFKGLKLKADIYHCHEPDSLLVGYLLKKKLNCRLIYDSHEMNALQFSQHFFWFLRRIIEGLINIYEKYMIKKVDYIITVNHSIKSYFLNLNKDVNVEILYNCPSLDLFKININSNTSNDHIICHEGFFPFDRGLKQLLEVMRILKNTEVELLIIGEIIGTEEKEWFNRKIHEYGYKDKIRITGWLPYTDVGEYISKATIGLILFQPVPENWIGLPNKLFNYMRYGLPIIASDFPEIRRIIQENNCGILVDPTNIQDIANAIIYLIQHPKEAKSMGKSGKNAVNEKYNWSEMEKRLLDIYKRLEEV